MEEQQHSMDQLKQKLLNILKQPEQKIKQKEVASQVEAKQKVFQSEASLMQNTISSDRAVSRITRSPSPKKKSSLSIPNEASQQLRAKFLTRKTSPRRRSSINNNVPREFVSQPNSLLTAMPSLIQPVESLTFQQVRIKQQRVVGSEINASPSVITSTIPTSLIPSKTESRKKQPHSSPIQSLQSSSLLSFDDLVSSIETATLVSNNTSANTTTRKSKVSSSKVHQTPVHSKPINVVGKSKKKETPWAGASFDQSPDPHSLPKLPSSVLLARDIVQKMLLSDDEDTERGSITPSSVPSTPLSRVHTPTAVVNNSSFSLFQQNNSIGGTLSPSSVQILQRQEMKKKRVQNEKISKNTLLSVQQSEVITAVPTVSHIPVRILKRPEVKSNDQSAEVQLDSQSPVLVDQSIKSSTATVLPSPNSTKSILLNILKNQRLHKN